MACRIGVLWTRTRCRQDQGVSCGALSSASAGFPTTRPLAHLNPSCPTHQRVVLQPACRCPQRPPRRLRFLLLRCHALRLRRLLLLSLRRLLLRCRRPWLAGCMEDCIGRVQLRAGGKPSGAVLLERVSHVLRYLRGWDAGGWTGRKGQGAGWGRGSAPRQKAAQTMAPDAPCAGTSHRHRSAPRARQTAGRRAPPGPAAGPAPPPAAAARCAASCDRGRTWGQASGRFGCRGQTLAYPPQKAAALWEAAAPAPTRRAPRRRALLPARGPQCAVAAPVPRFEVRVRELHAHQVDGAGEGGQCVVESDGGITPASSRGKGGGGGVGCA